MNYNKHFELEGKHALLSPSKHTWLNYSKDQLRAMVLNAQAAARGTKLHAMARDLIEEKIPLRGRKQTLAAYVNDAIGYGMIPEQRFYFSPNCFGTADAFLYTPGHLRIHDLKTGVQPTHMEQLEIYAALFMLEYERVLGVKPGNTVVDLAIYQSDDVIEAHPSADRIEQVIENIRTKDQWVEDIQGEDY